VNADTERATSSSPTVGEPWDLALTRRAGPHSLVAIGREGRLTRQGPSGSVRVDLTTVDETVLAIVDLALERGRDVALVYPAPAGQVSALLAGEILLRRFIQGEPSQSVGIVTSDTADAARTWEELGIAAMGSRTRVSEVFPSLRALPNGESPLGRRPFKGALIGRNFVDWPVDVVVVDHLCGPVEASPKVPTIHVFADPLDPHLHRLADQGHLIWGWSESDLAALLEAETSAPATVPFSVATDRLAVIAKGITTTVHVAHDAKAEMIIRRLRDDLRTAGDLAGPAPEFVAVKGLRVAWHHVSTLTSLPCRPSEFDRFAGLPPMAARSTRTFEPEIAAWATSLSGDLRDVAEVIASDLGDLRDALEHANPFAKDLAEAASRGSGTLIVLRTQTAARGFMEAHSEGQALQGPDRARVISIRRLHREAGCQRAIVVGTPAPWDWHRLDSGLSGDVHVFVIGDLDAHLARRALDALHLARSRWAAPETRTRVWRSLIDTEPPPVAHVRSVQRAFVLINALEMPPDVDPFESLRPLLDSVPLMVGDEDVEDSIAEEMEGGEWRSTVDAVEVTTDAGIIFLPKERLVDVRKGEEIVEIRADALQPGAVLLVDRRGGRLGLLEALAHRLKSERPDLLAANLLIADLRTNVRQRFAASGMNRTQLYEALRSLGFEKTYHAARSYVDDGGPLAPRDLTDLQRLNEALQMGMTGRRLTETFAGVRRWRTFRRAAGKALVAASRDSHAARGAMQVDPETGLTLDDLRELVLEATVVETRHCADLVSMAEIGHLREP
jgi:hypothetical protein